MSTRIKKKGILFVSMLVLFVSILAGTAYAKDIGNVQKWFSSIPPAGQCGICKGGHWSKEVKWWGTTNYGGRAAKNHLATFARNWPSGSSLANHDTPKKGSPNCAKAYTIMPNMYVGGGYQPNYPVVTTQDPARRGVDLWIGAIVTNAVNEYEVYERYYDCVKSSNYNSSCDDSKQHNLKKKWHQECVQYCQFYPDYITSLDSDYALDGGSIDWINGYLAQRYPGAHVKDGPFPKLFQWDQEIGIGKGSAIKWVDGKEFLDPGQYWIAISAHSHGTKISGSVSKKIVKSMRVHLRDETTIH